LNANAIIGPFYQSNAEIAARLLSVNNACYLIERYRKPYANYTRPYLQTKRLKNAMFDYAIKEWQYHSCSGQEERVYCTIHKTIPKGCTVCGFKENGSLSAESLKACW
jgi:hypothetical protein